MNETTLNTNNMVIDRVLDIRKASRTLATTTFQFMEVEYFKKQIRKEYLVLIDAEDEKIEVQKKTLESLANSSEERKAQAQELYNSVEKDCIIEKERLEKERDLLIDGYKFEKTEAHKTMQSKFKDNYNAILFKDSDITVTDNRDIVAEFFDSFGLDVRNSVFLDNIIKYAGYKWDDKVAVANDGNGLVFNSANCIKMCYYVTYVHQVRVDIVRKAMIPAIIQEEYYDKLKAYNARKAKKAEKKAKKEAKTSQTIVTSAEDVVQA